MGNEVGPAKSFNSAVNDCELWVLPMIVEMHGVWPPSSAVTRSVSNDSLSAAPTRPTTTTTARINNEFDAGCISRCTTDILT